MQSNGLPSLRTSRAAWDDLPPDPLDDPDLYDGITLRRVVAYLIDLLAIGALWLAAWVALSVLAALSLGLLLPFKIFALALLPLAYHTFFIGRNGGTPGMRLLDVEVRTWTGLPPSYVQALLHTVMFYASVSLTFWVVLVIVFFDDRRRTLHDMLAGIVCLRHSRLAAPGLQTA